MKVSWLGHACFLIEGGGVRVLTDPYDESLDYCTPDPVVDVVTVSHEHFDHNAVGRVSGDPTVLRGVGEHDALGVKFIGIASFHDDKGGAERGENTIFSFDIDGLHVAHLGDLGVPLTKKQAEDLSSVELLLIPVGGTYTIGPAEAASVVASLPAVRVVVPMHFKTDRLGEGFPIAPVDDFAKEMEHVKRIGSSEFTVSKDDLPPRKEVWILDYAQSIG